MKWNSRWTNIRWKEQKQDIGDIKQDIGGVKQDIDRREKHVEVAEDVSKKTKQHIQELFETFGYDQFFGRTEVMRILSITASPASTLIKRMLEMKLIYPLKGKGKGKYLFSKEKLTGEEHENEFVFDERRNAIVKKSRYKEIIVK